MPAHPAALPSLTAGAAPASSAPASAGRCLKTVRLPALAYHCGLAARCLCTLLQQWSACMPPRPLTPPLHSPWPHRQLQARVHPGESVLQPAVCHQSSILRPPGGSARLRAWLFEHQLVLCRKRGVCPDMITPLRWLCAGVEGRQCRPQLGGDGPRRLRDGPGLPGAAAPGAVAACLLGRRGCLPASSGER